MKFALKLFCIGLLAAGFAVTGCDRLNEAAEEATAEETEEAAEEEEEAADEEEEAADEEDEAADEDDEAAEEEEDGADAGDEEAAADEEDGEDEAAAAEEEEDDTKKTAEAPKPKQPPFVGTVEGSVGGGGVTDGKLRITVNREYKANGTFTGKHGDKPFRVSFNGAVDKKSSSLSASGGKRGDSVRVSGKVTESAIGGKLTGKVNGSNVTVRYTLKN